ncbi:uncharacterized protein LOC119731729 [Patiria miniata]|uniref:receptor protein-tyrosine kinase n=1 Tax=Patiria miniata TaxID=46514 RepID=A0A914ABQ1_PATMI|nr:uncharacterized protein LOC119731729 [Patiria miniata]
MDVLLILALFALLFQLSKGEGGTLRILPAENYVASIGDNATFTCLVTGRQTDRGPGVDVLWQKSRQILQRCSFQPPGDQEEFEEHCKLSIAPVRRTSAGLYECVLFYLTSTTKNLQLDVVEPNTTVEVTDLLTGKLVDSDSEPICVRRSGSAVRGFECTVRDAEPNAWNIAWLVGGERVVTGFVETGVGRLVKVSSTFNLSQLQTEFPKNLTCQATGLDRLISITVALRSCHGIHLKPFLDLWDLSTGRLVGLTSTPICIQPDTERHFRCQLRTTRPEIWDVAWFIDGEESGAGLTNFTSSEAGGLVNVSSRFIISKWRDDGTVKSLTCRATNEVEESLNVTVHFEPCSDMHPKPFLELWDLSTGRLVGLTSSPICIQSDTERHFQCQLKSARPGIWDVAWLIDGTDVGAGFTNFTSGTPSGLVNRSSRFVISKWRSDDTVKSLTCRASNEEESLNVTVHLETCSDRVKNASMNLMDLSTGKLVGVTSGPICLKMGTKRTFACTILDVRPDIVVTWIIDGIRNESRRVDVTPATGGLVNMNASFSVFTSLDGSLINSLTCMATGFKTKSLLVTLQLQTCPEIVSNTSMELLDLSTGEFISDASEAICVTSETGKAFGCTVRQATPDSWRIAWVIDGVREETGSVVQTPSTDELVDIFSRFTVSNPTSADVVKSLTCQATSLAKEELAVTVHLRSCAGNKPAIGTINMTMLFAIVGVLSGMLVLAVAALVISSSRAKRKYHVPVSAQSVPNLQESVEMESVAPDSESDPTAVKEEVTYQNTIAQPRKMTEEIPSDTGLPSWAEGWGIPWSDLIVEERVLGSGNFGEVRYGTVRKDEDLNRAAIKMLKGHVSSCDRDDFMDELWTMTFIGYHPNIVELLGACQHQGVLYVALEYLPYGDLRSYLRTARSQSDSDEDALSSDQLVKLALGVARGMEHLAKAGVIHRDLAARNILIGNGLVAKVSDFGLSRGENIYVQTSRRRVPLRWLSIESVRHQLYTTQSDVWSFGILLWEIATFGGTPYPTISNDLLVETIKRGYRMPKPDNCHEQIYALMRDCWDEDPNNRPTFTDLVYILSDMADNRIKHTYMAVIRNEYQNMSAILPELDDN